MTGNWKQERAEAEGSKEREDRTNVLCMCTIWHDYFEWDGTDSMTGLVGQTTREFAVSGGYQ